MVSRGSSERVGCRSFGTATSESEGAGNSSIGNRVCPADVWKDRKRGVWSGQRSGAGEMGRGPLGELSVSEVCGEKMIFTLSNKSAPLIPYCSVKSKETSYASSPGVPVNEAFVPCHVPAAASPRKPPLAINASLAGATNSVVVPLGNVAQTKTETSDGTGPTSGNALGVVVKKVMTRAVERSAETASKYHHSKTEELMAERCGASRDPGVDRNCPLTVWFGAIEGMVEIWGMKVANVVVSRSETTGRMHRRTEPAILFLLRSLSK